MFEITKIKGKPYKTEDAEKALQAYKRRKALNMFFNGGVVKSKCIPNPNPQQGIWNKINKYRG